MNANEDEDGFHNDNNDTAQRIEQIERKLAITECAASLGLSEKLAVGVYDLGKKSGLTAAESLAVLRERDPSTYGDPLAGASFQHGSLRPSRSGPQPKADPARDYAERLEYTQQLRKTNRREAGQLANNMAGKFLAEALGWEHEMIPIPRRQG